MASNEEVDVMAEHSYGGVTIHVQQTEQQDSQGTVPQDSVIVVVPQHEGEIPVAMETEETVLIQDTAPVIQEGFVETTAENQQTDQQNNAVINEGEVSEEIVAEAIEGLVAIAEESSVPSGYTDLRCREEAEDIIEIAIPAPSDSRLNRDSTDTSAETMKRTDEITKNSTEIEIVYDTAEEILEIFPFVCGICSSKFDKIKKFYSHFKTHSEFKSALHVCGKDGGDESGKKAAGDELFSCGVCESEFPSMCLLHDHMVRDEMIADYRYYNHVVMPVYGRVVRSKGLEQKDEDMNYAGKTKSQDQTESPAKRPRGRPRKEKKDVADAEPDDESRRQAQRVNKDVADAEPDDESRRQTQKLNKDVVNEEPDDGQGQKPDEREAAESDDGSQKVPSTPSTPHSYGTRRRSNLQSEKSETKSTTTKRKVKEERETVVVHKTPSRPTANQEILQKNFEMSTRKRTYKMSIQIKEEKPDSPDQEENIDAEAEKDELNTQLDDLATEELPTKEEEYSMEYITDDVADPDYIDVSEAVSKDGSYVGKKSSKKSNEQKRLMSIEHNDEEDLEDMEKDKQRRSVMKNSKAKYLPCPECDKVLPRKGLARHRVVHMNSRNYECIDCGKTYKSQSHLTDHKRVVHAERIHPCEICGKSFKTRQAQLKHINLHRRKGEDAVVDIEGTDQDEVDVKPEGDRVACTLCNKSVLKASMRKHMFAHSNVRNYKCDVCGTAFKLQSHVKEHMDVVHLKLKKYKCDFCNARFKSSKNLWVHRNSHLNPDDPLYSKELVEKIQKEQKEKEMRKKYAMPKTVVCDLCGKTVLLKRLNRHKSIHKKDKDFECDICGKKFITQRYVRDHKLKVHQAKRTFCDICGQFFKGKGYLEKHRQIHGPKDKVCNTCGKAFTTDFYLKLHEQTHTDRKAFKCEQCPACFSHKKRLVEHMAEKHDIGEKRPCKYCYLLFPSRQKARFHERKVHEGFEEKKKSRRRRLQIKQEPITVGEEYHVIVSQDMSGESGDPQIKILTENMEQTEEVEYIDASTSVEEEGTVTHSQLLDAVIQSGAQEIAATGEQVVEIDNGTEIVQHVLEIPETADRVCALVVYPDGSYRLVNPDEIGPDVKIVAEVATG